MNFHYIQKQEVCTCDGNNDYLTIEYMRKGLGIFLENCEKPAATQN